MNLGQGNACKGKEIFGVGKSNVIQIGFEIDPQLLGKAIREICLGKTQMLCGTLQRNARSKIFQHIENGSLNVGRMIFGSIRWEA